MEHATVRFSIGDDPSALGWIDLSRRLFIKGVGIACLGFVPLLQACDDAFLRGGKANGAAGAGSVPRAIRPPLDASAPLETRTATFALG